MGIMKSLFSNTKKPDGWMGRMMVNSMNSGHAKVSDWGLSHLSGIQPVEIVELGCGGGRTAAKLLQRYPKARLTAVDYSDVSVEKTSQVNRKEIQAERCQVVQGDVSSLVFKEERFDLATAFETIYFWPGPVDSFREVYRVLKRGGTFLIVNESDGQNKSDEKWTHIIDGMRVYTAEMLRQSLSEAGFGSIAIDCDEKNHWLCALARKQ